MEQVCITNLPEFAGMAVTGIVTVASLVANVVKADSVLGKAVHFAALNFKVSK